MASQFWFGTENRFQLAPCPATGMQASDVGYSEILEYQNGRKGVSRSHQSHKEFGINFPVQEAGGLTGLDVFGKFASGFYGDMDDYPIFFADPMNYDQNLLPPHFAEPGLYRRGWGAIVDDGPKQYTNYAYNPSLEFDTGGWSFIAGTSGTVTPATRVGPDTTLAYVGQYRWQQTWSVATSVVSGGVQFTGSATPASTGSTMIGGYMYVNSVSKQQRMQATLRFRDGGGTQLGTASGTASVVAINTWTKMEVPLSAAPNGTVRTDIEVVAVAGTSATTWGINNILRADAAMLYATEEPPIWFDYNTPGAGYVGIIGVNTLRSVYYVSRQIPTFGTTPANIYNLPPQGIIWNVTSAANAEPGPASNIPYAIIPIPPGYRLHIGWCGALTGTAEIVVEGWNAPLSKQSTTAMTPLSSAASTRMNTTVTGVDYAKVYVRRTTNVASTVNITSMMAQLWPTAVSPTLTGNFIEGKGHRGLKFGDNAIPYEYVMVDPNRPSGILHLKGMSTTLIEAQERG